MSTVHQLCPHPAAPAFVFPASDSSLNPIRLGFTSGWEQNRFGNLSEGCSFALHRAEEEALHHHEALAGQALFAGGALEALRLGVPVELAIGNPLGLRLDHILAGHTFLGRGSTQ